MDLFGKILVLVNFAISLMMAAIGGTVLYYRVDWSNNPADATTGAPAGELVARIARVKELQGLVTPADPAWRDARASLLAQEERRKGDEVWYAAELEHLKTGDASKEPILEVVYDKGQTTPDPKTNGRPMMQTVADRFGKTLQSLIWYNGQQATVNEDTAVVLGKIAKAVQEDTELTSRLITEKPPAGSGLRGLLDRAKDEASKQDEIAEEMKLVFLAEGQERADTQLLLLRKKALEARVKELTGVAAGQ